MYDTKTSDETCLYRIINVMNTPVTIHLINGVKLSGHITEVLADGVILTRDGASQVVFAHAIGTVMPSDGNATVTG